MSTATHTRRRGTRVPLLLLLLALMSCAPSTTSYVHPDVDLAHIQRCAILPFQNLSQDGYADERLHSLFLMSILREGSLQIIEPGAVFDAMARQQIPAGASLSPEQCIALGKELAVDGIFFGSVQEFGMARDQRRQVSQVTALFGLIETQTGVTVWRAQVHLDGSSLLRRLFGGESRSLHAVSETAVDRALRTLL